MGVVRSLSSSFGSIRCCPPTPRLSTKQHTNSCRQHVLNLHVLVSLCSFDSSDSFGLWDFMLPRVPHLLRFPFRHLHEILTLVRCHHQLVPHLDSELSSGNLRERRSVATLSTHPEAWLALRGASVGGFVFSTRGLNTWARARLSRCLVVLARQPCASWSLLPRLVPSSVCRHDVQQGSQQVSQSSERYKEGRWPLVTGKHSGSAFTTRCAHARTHTRAW